MSLPRADPPAIMVIPFCASYWRCHFNPPTMTSNFLPPAPPRSADDPLSKPAVLCQTTHNIGRLFPLLGVCLPPVFLSTSPIYARLLPLTFSWGRYICKLLSRKFQNPNRAFFLSAPKWLASRYGIFSFREPFPFHCPLKRALSALTRILAHSCAPVLHTFDLVAPLLPAPSVFALTTFHEEGRRDSVCFRHRLFSLCDSFRLRGSRVPFFSERSFVHPFVS